MAKKVLVALLLMFVGTFIMHVVARYPSAIFITLGDKTIQLSVWFGIFLYVFSIGAVYLGFVSIRALVRPVLGSLSWLRSEREKKAARRTQRGLVNFVEGNWLAAKKDLLGAAKDVEKPLVNYLAAARSAFELGDSEESKYLLEQAQKSDPTNQVSIQVSRARMFFLAKKYDDSLAILKDIEKHAATNPSIVELLRENYICLRDWSALVALLPRLQSSGVYNDEEFATFEENTYLSLLDAKISGAQPSSTTDKASQSIADFWFALPKAQKNNPKLVGLYCTYLKNNGADDDAEGLVRRALQLTWHAGLVELYGKLKASDKKAQLKSAETWLKTHKEDAFLFSTLGAICVRNELWGKARGYFESSLRLRERPEVYAALGELMRNLGEHQKSSRYFEKGLLISFHPKTES